MQVATKIGIHYRVFSGDNFFCKNFKKLSLVKSISNITQNTGLSSAPHNSAKLITDNFMGVFWNSCTKNFAKFSEKHIRDFSFDITNTAYYRTINCNTDEFWKCSERKGYFKILKIPKKNFFFTFVFKLGFTPTATQLLQGMELQDKEALKD